MGGTGRARCGARSEERDLVRERYYEHRAPVYDVTSYRGDPEVDAGLDRETAAIGRILTSMASERILEVGCGTALWTRYLQGRVVGVDLSSAMLDQARARVPKVGLVRGRVPELPFADQAFDTLLTANFYGLLRPQERAAFMAEVRRLARELVVVDLRSDNGQMRERTEVRRVDGQTYPIYRRRFAPEVLRAELGGDLLYTGRYFLAVRTPLHG